MDDLFTLLRQAFVFDQQVTANLVNSLAIIVALGVVQIFALGAVRRAIEDGRARYQWAKAIRYGIFFIGLLLIGSLWFQGLQNLATYLGLASAGLVIALRDPLTDLVYWLFIIWRRPLKLGDRVQIGEHLGDVIDLDAFHVTLMEAGRWADGEQSTGRLLKLPNRLVAGAVVANYTSGLEIIWDEFTVTLTLESNWHKGRDLLQEIGDRLVSPPTGELMERYRHLTSQYLLEQGPLTPAVYVKLSERGVGLSLRYLCLPRQRRDVQRALSEEVLNIFAGHDDLRMMRVPQG